MAKEPAHLQGGLFSFRENLMAKTTKDRELVCIFGRENHVFLNATSRTIVGTAYPLKVDEGEDSSIVVKGDADSGDLVSGLEYRFWGRFEDHYRHGPQFVFSNFIASTPVTEEGVVGYLKRLNGIGHKTALKIIETFGLQNAVETFRERIRGAFF